jgi:hypothetical protein
MTRKLVISLLVLLGFSTLAFGSMDADDLEEMAEDID